jgi:hypothetical protein
MQVMKRSEYTIFKLLFVAVFSFALQASAQEPSFSWGLALPKVAKKQTVTIFGQADPVYYVVTQQPPGPGEFTSSYQLDAFRSNHDRIFSKNITPSSQYDIAGAAFINNKPVLFYYAFNKDSGKDILYAVEYSSDGNAGTPKEITSNPAEKMSQRGRYNLTQSPDHKLALVSYEPNFRKGENEQLQLTLLDDKMNRQWSSTQILPYEWKRGVNNFIQVNNSGVAFIVKRMVVKGEDNSYSILSFDGKKLTDNAVDLGEGKKVAAAGQVINDNGELVLGGYYTEDKSIKFGSTSFNGAFVYSVSAQGDKVLVKVASPFDEKRKNMSFKYIYPLKNGFVLLGQKATESSSLSTEPAKASKGEYDYKYYSGDIYADAFDATGKKLFATSIHRDLDSKNDNGISNSFFAAISNDKLIVIYNDEQYRYDGKKHVVLFGYQALIPVLVTINTANGEAQKPVGLFNSNGVGGKNAEMRMRPDVFARINGNSFLLRGENNELFKMGSVTF